MSTQTKTKPSMATYWESIEAAGTLLSEADAVLIGAGAGLSASGGFDYGDESRVRALFPAHHACGLTTVTELLSAFWMVNRENATAFWAVWARHIYETIYAASILEPYQRLFQLMQDKRYFVISTNVDEQFAKAGFPAERLFEPQGRYSLFQCSIPCSQEIYENHDMVKAMLANMPSPLAIREKDVPLCPHCGNLLMPNLRCDGRFVEKPHLVNRDAYLSFVEQNEHKKLLLLELGVGFNSPGVIRYPFDTLARSFKNTRLVRINAKYADVLSNSENGIGIQADLSIALADLLALHTKVTY